MARGKKTTKRKQAQGVFIKSLILLIFFAYVFYYGNDFMKQQKRVERVSGRFIGSVIKVVDEKDIIIKPNNRVGPVRCALFGIGVPRLGDGKESESELHIMVVKRISGLLAGRKAEVYLTGYEFGDRELCVIKIDNMDVSKILLGDGLLYASRFYLDIDYDNREYLSVERRARLNRRGFWKDFTYYKRYALF